MTTHSIEQAILEAVMAIYHKKYVGKLKVTQLTNGYQLLIWLNKQETPISISADLNAENFIKYIKEELRSRRFHEVKYYTGYKYEPLDDTCERNKSCSCNDKGRIN